MLKRWNSLVTGMPNKTNYHNRRRTLCSLLPVWLLNRNGVVNPWTRKYRNTAPIKESGAPTRKSQASFARLFSSRCGNPRSLRISNKNLFTVIYCRNDQKLCNGMCANFKLSQQRGAPQFRVQKCARKLQKLRCWELP